MNGIMWLQIVWAVIFLAPPYLAKVAKNCQKSQIWFSARARIFRAWSNYRWPEGWLQVF